MRLGEFIGKKIGTGPLRLPQKSRLYVAFWRKKKRKADLGPILRVLWVYGDAFHSTLWVWVSMGGSALKPRARRSTCRGLCVHKLSHSDPRKLCTHRCALRSGQTPVHHRGDNWTPELGSSINISPEQRHRLRHSSRKPTRLPRTRQPPSSAAWQRANALSRTARLKTALCFN